MGTLFPARMGVGPTLAAAIGHSLLRNFAGHPVRPRDGSLSVLPLLWSASHAAVLYPGSHVDRHARRCDSYQGTDPFPGCVVRHRYRRADRRICGRGGNPGSCPALLETDSCGPWAFRAATRLSADLLSDER